MINVYVFSGTGNTLLVANKIAEIFNKNNNLCSVTKMENIKPSDINLDGTIGIGWTVAFWNTYPFVRKWIDNLPDGMGTKVFLFDTMGDSSCRMIAHIAEILKNKNYNVIAAQGFIMPNNFLLVLKDDKNKQKIEKTFVKVEKYVQNIIKNKAVVAKTNIFTKIAFIITSFITTKLWNTKLAKKIMKFKTDKTKCNGCGVCVKLCPLENIEIKTIPEFKNKCIFCLRCVSYCPQQALSNKILLKTYRALPRWDNLIV